MLEASHPVHQPNIQEVVAMTIRAMPPKMRHDENVSSHSMASDLERVTVDCTGVLCDHSALKARRSAGLVFFGMARVGVAVAVTEIPSNDYGNLTTSGSA